MSRLFGLLRRGNLRTPIQQFNNFAIRPFATGVEVHGNTKVTTLPNGFRVATQETNDESATVGVWIDAGSAYENERNNGVAHFLEHMAFKGTSKRTGQSLELEVENLGAALNAYTSREQTCYYAKVLKNNVPQAVDILSDILQNATLSNGDVERERRTILREKEDVENNAREVIFDYLHSASYQGTSLGHTILGPEANIKSITREDLVSYVRTHYTAPRMVLAAAGGVNHDQLVDIASKSFSNLQNSPHPVVSKPYFTGSQVTLQEYDPGHHVHYAISFESVGWSHPDFYTFMVLQALLGNWDVTSGGANNLASRLCEIVASENLAHSIQTFNTYYHQTGLFGIYTIAHHDKLIEITFEFLNELQRLTKMSSSNEVERAKTKLKASLLMQLDTTTQICEDIGRQMLTLNRRMPLEEMIARVDDIELADVCRVIDDHFYDTDPTVVAIGNLEHLPDYNMTRSQTYWKRL